MMNDDHEALLRMHETLAGVMEELDQALDQEEPEVAYWKRQVDRIAKQRDEFRDSLHRGVELRIALDNELNAEHKRRVVLEEDCQRLQAQLDAEREESCRPGAALAVKSDPKPAAEMGKIIDDLVGERDNLLAERVGLWEEREKAQEKFEKIEGMYCKEINKGGDLDRRVFVLRGALADVRDKYRLPWVDKEALLYMIGEIARAALDKEYGECWSDTVAS